MENNGDEQPDGQYEKRLIYALLAVIFLLALGLRLYYAFSTPTFTDPESYSTLRQVDHIRETGLPLYMDDLSYGARRHVLLPMYEYVLAFFSLFMPVVTACKLIPNIFATTAVFAVFIIVRQITRNERIALLSSFVSGFIPIYVSETLNTLTPYSMTIPVMLFLMYFFLRINIKKNPNYFILLVMLLILLDLSAYILVFGILLYLLLSWVEGLNVGRAEIELALFSLFIMSLLYIIVFRDAFLMNGYMVIWNNIPQSLLAKYFSDVDIGQAILAIGVFPAIAGVAVILIHLFRKKKSVYLPMSIAILTSFFLALKLVPLKLGLMVLSLIFVILFGEMFSILIEYIKKTRFISWRPVLYAVFVLIFFATSVWPSVTYAQKAAQDSVVGEQLLAFDLLMNITDPADTIVSTVYDGHLVTYFSQRRNIMDSDFLLIDDAEERLADLRVIYTSAVSSRPIEVMDKYSADYIIMNNAAREFYNITRLSYVDEECFPVVFAGQKVLVYKKRCSLG